MIRLRVRKNEEQEIIEFCQQQGNISAEVRVAIKILMYLKNYFQNNSAQEVYVLIKQQLPQKQNKK
ncbi:MAG: hypothetical protein ACRC3A_07930 [Culicoidibacterales bacterium]